MGLHRWKNDDKDGVVDNTVVLKKGDELFWDYSTWGTDCAAAKLYFEGLSLTQKLALAGVTRAMPSPPSGNYYKEEVCGGTTPTYPTQPTDPGTPTNDLEEDIVFTGQNVSDAPSTNPAVMSVAFTYIGNGENTAKVSWTQAPEAGKSLRIVYNTMGYLSVAEIEGRTYPCGEDNLFQGYHMTGLGDDNQRSDIIPNATQILHIK